MASFGNNEQGFCPYCGERPPDSEDHIFLQAICGRRTIPACKPCNDRFGHTFEGRAVAKFLHPMLVQLGGIGVPVIDPGAIWKSASVRSDGQVYDASLSPAGLKVHSTRPLVRKDAANPNVMHVVVGNDPVGQKHFQRILNSGKFRVTATELVRVNNPQMEANIEWGHDLKFTALKMAFATATLAFPEEVGQFGTARKELAAADESSPPSRVAPDLRDHPALDRLRDSLCHVIYLEQYGRKLQAFVQFFGAIQFWVELTQQTLSSYEIAMIATLDPITGVERFDEIAPLKLPPFEPGYVDPRLPIKKLNAAAAERGGKTNEMIKLNRVQCDGVDISRPKPYVVTSWTGDFLWTKHRAEGEKTSGDPSAPVRMIPPKGK